MENDPFIIHLIIDIINDPFIIIYSRFYSWSTRKNYKNPKKNKKKKEHLDIAWPNIPTTVGVPTKPLESG
jgi:hypothetical protein